MHRVANESSRPWVWWDFVTDFHARCSMKKKKYSKECAEDVVKSLRKFIQRIWLDFFVFFSPFSDVVICSVML